MNHLTEKDYFEKVLDGDSDISIAYWNGEDWTVNGNLKSTKGILLSKEDLIGLIDDAMIAQRNWDETYTGWFIPTLEQHMEKRDEFLESKNLLTNDTEK